MNVPADQDGKYKYLKYDPNILTYKWEFENCPTGCSTCNLID